MNLYKATLIFGIVLVVASCGGADERKAAYMEKAEKSLQAGDLEKARIELKNVLQIDPKDAGAYFKIATIFEKKEDYRKAFANFSKAAELAPENAEYQARIGKYYLVLGNDVDKATEILERIKSAAPENDHATLLEAGILYQQGKVEQARMLAEKLFKKDPSNTDNALFLSTLYQRLDDYQDAVRVLEGALAENQSNTKIKLHLADALYGSGDMKKAELIFKEILDEDRSNYANYLNLARFYFRTGKKDKAKEILYEAVSEDKDDARRRSEYIAVIKKTEGIDAAVDVARTMVAEASGEGELVLRLGQLYAESGDIDASIDTFKQVVEDYPDDELGIRARLALARLYLVRDRNSENASKYIEEAYKIAPNDSNVNLLKAKLALSNNNLEQGIISLRTVIKDNPENLEAYSLLASAHRANGEVAQADDVIARAYEANRGRPDSLLALSRYHLKNKNLSMAETIIDDYLRIKPKGYEGLSIKAAILNSTKRVDEGEKYARSLIDNYPERVNGYIQAIPGLLKKGKKDEAVDLLRKGLDETSNSFKLLAIYSKMLVSEGRDSEAISYLKSELKQKSRPDISLLLAKILIGQKNREEAAYVIEQAIRSNPDVEILYSELASLYMSMGKEEEAVRILEQGIANVDSEKKLRIMRAGLHEKYKQYDKAIALYEQAVADNKNIIAANNAISLLIDERGDEKSLQKASNFIKLLEGVNNPAVMDTVAWYKYHMGDYDDAIALFEKILSRAPNNPIYQYHAGMAYLKAGRELEAKKYLQNSLDSGKKFPGKDRAEKEIKKLGV